MNQDQTESRVHLSDRLTLLPQAATGPPWIGEHTLNRFLPRIRFLPEGRHQIMRLVLKLHGAPNADIQQVVLLDEEERR